MSHQWKKTLITFLCILALTGLKAEEQKLTTDTSRLFFTFNNDLRRVGYSEFANIAYPYLKEEVYRIAPDYRLGLGDIIMIVLSGKIQDSHKMTIDQDGKIVLPQIGEIYIMGLTIEQAKNTIQNEVDKKYSNVKVGFSLAAVQEIRISVLGNVKNPGVHLVSPFSRLMEGVAKAGGPTTQGTLINIKLFRNNREVVKFNAYDYLFKAQESDNNASLKDGDTIFIPDIKNIIAIRGDVIAPGIYEIEDKTKLSEAIKVARGLISRNITRKVQIIRLDIASGLFKKVKEMKILTSGNFENNDDFVLENEDTVLVATIEGNIPYPEETSRIVIINGWVNNPGEYIIEKGEKLSSLLKRAGGLKEDAYLEGTIFTRNSVAEEERNIINEKKRIIQTAISREQTVLLESNLSNEEKTRLQRAIDEKKKNLDILAGTIPKGRIIIDLGTIIKGQDDLVLEKKDEIYIPKKPDWVLVSGEVYNSTSVKFSPDKDINYYLNQVGGIKATGDEENIYVVKANGKAESKITGYGKILPGDVIIVPEKDFNQFNKPASANK